MAAISSPHRVDQQMALAPVDLLSGIIAARPGRLRRLHRLAVDDPGRRARLAPFRFARSHHQRVVDARPRSIVAPAIEIVLHRRERRELLGQHPPPTTALGDVEDCIHHMAHRGFPRAAAPMRRRQVRRDHRPFLIRRVACITPPIPPILRASDFSPGHRWLRRSSQLKQEPDRSLTDRGSRGSWSRRSEEGIEDELNSVHLAP